MFNRRDLDKRARAALALAIAIMGTSPSTLALDDRPGLIDDDRATAGRTATQPRQLSDLRLPIQLPVSVLCDSILRELPASHSGRHRAELLTTVYRMQRELVEDVERRTVRKVIGHRTERVRIGRRAVYGPVEIKQNLPWPLGEVTKVVDRVVGWQDIYEDRLVEIWGEVEELVPIHREIEKRVEELRLVEADVRYQLDLVSFDLSLEGERVTTHVVCDVTLDAVACFAGTSVRIASAGVSDPPGRIELTVVGKLETLPDATLRLDGFEWAIRWLRPCSLTCVGVTAEELIELPGVKSRVRDAIDEGLTRLRVEQSFRAEFEATWNRLFEAQPWPVGGEAWFVVDPVGLWLSDVTGRDGLVEFTVSVQAYPRVVFGTRPEGVPRRMPPIGSGPTGSAFRVTVETELELAAASTHVSTALTSHLLPLDGFVALRVREARLFATQAPDGQTLLNLGVSVTESSSELVLRVVPVLDLQAQLLRFEWRGAGSSDHDENVLVLPEVVTRSIVEQAVVPLATIFDRAVTAGSTVKAGPWVLGGPSGLVLEVCARLGALRAGGVRLDPRALTLELVAEGEALARVSRLSANR